MPLSVTPMLHSRTARAADKRHKIYQRNARDARSCDNIDGLDQSSAYCYGRVIPPYAKVSVERMNGPFIPSFQGPPVYADGSFMPAQPYLYQPKANGSIYSNLNRQMAVGQMSPGKSHRVQPYAPVVHQLTQQLPPPLRLTDSCPSTYNSVSANQTDRKKKYHRNSRSSCSTFSNSESTPFLLNETPPQPSQRAQESLTPLVGNEGVTSFNQDQEYFVDSDPESYLSHSCSDEESPKTMNQLKPLILPSLQQSEDQYHSNNSNHL